MNTPSIKKGTNEEEKISFQLPNLNRDQSINLGQSIVALVGVNVPEYFTEEQNKEDIGLLFIDILKHFNISIADLYKMDLLENVLDPEYEYQIEVNMDYKIIKKDIR